VAVGASVSVARGQKQKTPKGAPVRICRDSPLTQPPDAPEVPVPAQSSGYRPEMPGLSYNNNMKGWGPELCARRPDITMAMVDTFLGNMYGGARADFVYTVTRDFVRNCQTPILVFARRRSGTPLCRGDGDRASRAQRAGKPLSVEGHRRQDSAGAAPYPHLSPCPSTYCSSALYGSRRSVAPDTSFPASPGAWHDGPQASRRATRQWGRSRPHSARAVRIAVETAGQAYPERAQSRRKRSLAGADHTLLQVSPRRNSGGYSRSHEQCGPRQIRRGHTRTHYSDRMPTPITVKGLPR
jgi:hypothetical protein